MKIYVFPSPIKFANIVSLRSPVFICVNSNICTNIPLSSGQKDLKNSMNQKMIKKNFRKLKLPFSSWPNLLSSVFFVNGRLCEHTCTRYSIKFL